MSSNLEGVNSRPCWFVGATYDKTNDQTPRFVRDGIWENGYDDRYLDQVKSIQIGDRIAIKSTYVRKYGLPFDNRGHSVSVMAIKATGRVVANPKDGKTITVEWREEVTPREWYFYTNLRTIWKVMAGDWANDALIDFTFNGKGQDLDVFRNHPSWRDRFGDLSDNNRRFPWTLFYEAIADKLLLYKDRRSELLAGIYKIAEMFHGVTQLNDRLADGSVVTLNDICPFTVIGIFNRGITEQNRKAIALELADFLGVSIPVPESFDGIPTLNNQKSWFFSFHFRRQTDDIDKLWELFARALDFADSEDANARVPFITAYNDVLARYGVGWNITMGLYWIRPWFFPTLDSHSQRYISERLNIEIGLNGPKGRANATDYLAILDALVVHFKEDGYPVHSFPELSLVARLYKSNQIDDEPQQFMESEFLDEEASDYNVSVSIPIEPYSVVSIINDGCFIERETLDNMLERLRTKKNIILQGPPGTGKTWLAKRLAYALMGQRDESKLRAVQFHPNLSYEDFVRGWRPAVDGKLSLLDGPFVEMINSALKEPEAKHVIVVEEINRGNPAQIFGELLTLLEADKRTPAEALELSYRKHPNERVFIPANLYVIGTMNIADRSLALVDLALRRRFAFVELQPKLGKLWHDWVLMRCGVQSDVLVEIEKRIKMLNELITADNALGSQFCIGHSYVTPSFDHKIKDGRVWFRQVVETEIGPLLDEYWFDDLEKSRNTRKSLLEGF